MKGNRNLFMSRLLVISCVLITTLVVFVIGYRLETTPSEDSPMDRWVGIATVCTALASIVVGLITIWVMFDQQKTQDELIKYQKLEHQPNYILKITEYRGQDENGKDSSFEELVIYNMGNQSYLIKNIAVDVFITWDCNFKDKHFNDRILFFDYFITKKRESDNTVYVATSNRDKRNLAKYSAMNRYANSLPSAYDVPDMFFEKDIMTKIEYIDLYEEAHIKYYRNGYPVDKDTYLKLSKYSNQASIDNFDMWEYRKEHHNEWV